MRIGTWNLEQKWTQAHADLIEDQECDVWLLTEVCTQSVESLQLAGWNCRHSDGFMTPRNYWSAIASCDEMTLFEFPLHPASVATNINGTTFCSSVLPWSACRSFSPHPWVGSTLAEMATAPLESIRKLPKGKTVWGGDWNQNLEGGYEYVGSGDMRELLEDAIKALQLQVPTRELPHRLGLHTIDHIAVPIEWTAIAKRIEADGLSDHDAYIVDVNEKQNSTG